MWLYENWIQTGVQESCLKNFLKMRKSITQFLKKSRKTGSFKKAIKALMCYVDFLKNFFFPIAFYLMWYNCKSDMKCQYFF
jgi:hypothetical protein